MFYSFIRLIPWACLLGGTGGSVLFYQMGPERWPIHWAAPGTPDRFMEKDPIPLVVLLVAAGIICVGLTLFSPKVEIDDSKGAPDMRGHLGIVLQMLNATLTFNLAVGAASLPVGQVFQIAHFAVGPPGVIVFYLPLILSSDALRQADDSLLNRHRWLRLLRGGKPGSGQAPYPVSPLGAALAIIGGVLTYQSCLWLGHLIFGNFAMV